jgi:hypothetical protein
VWKEASDVAVEPTVTAPLASIVEPSRPIVASDSLSRISAEIPVTALIPRLGIWESVALMYWSAVASNNPRSS